MPFRIFCEFKSVSMEQIEDIVKKANKTYCGRDPFPIKDIMETEKKIEVLKIYHKIVNLSLSKGIFPKLEKLVEVKPTLKGKLDAQKLESYRPITNASFLSKVIEIAAKDQLCEHLEIINVIPEQQSAYRGHHSTETALCGIVNDMLECLDEGKCGILILLDLSAAFDTVEHELLIDDLKYAAIEGDVLKWFRSYLTERKYYVTINGEKSETKSLQRGVPQGSVLGPILFSVYTLELSYILEEHGVKYKLFADDTQFFICIDNIKDTIGNIDNILKDIKEWMNNKKLKLNEGKTEVLLIGAKQNVQVYNDVNSVLIGNNRFELKDSVKDLGLRIDKGLTLNEQINNIVKVACYSLKNIAFIRKYLDEASLKKLVHNLVMSRLDYCNSLYYNLPVYQLRKIQMVMNRAARLIGGVSPRERITPILIELHWLLIKARMIYKICLLTYVALNKDKPKYLREKLTLFNTGLEVSVRHSHDVHRLNEPRSRTNNGTRAFSHSAPRLYNKLPNKLKECANVEMFKKKLKTYLFEKCYDMEDKTITDEFKV